MQSRRAFLRTTTAMIAGTVGGCTGDPDDGAHGGEDVDGTTSTDDAGSGTDDGVGSCELSPADIEGPFYRPGIPVGGNLDRHGDVGIALELAGRVSDTSCEPVQNAVVELWHATPRAPDGQPGDVKATYDDSSTYRYYGQVATDQDGRFTFVTLEPGWYLNGDQYRPAHLHIKVWVGSEVRLTTQLYFDADPFNDADPWFNPAMALAPDASGRASIDLVV